MSTAYRSIKVPRDPFLPQEKPEKLAPGLLKVAALARQHFPDDPAGVMRKWADQEDGDPWFAHVADLIERQDKERSEAEGATSAGLTVPPGTEPKAVAG